MGRNKRILIDAASRQTIDNFFLSGTLVLELAICSRSRAHTFPLPMAAGGTRNG
jgi:hypothetical protein